MFGRKRIRALEAALERKQGVADRWQRDWEKSQAALSEAKMQATRHQVQTYQEHIVKVPSRDMVKLRAWMADPNGSLNLGAATLEAWEGGGIWIRTRRWRMGDL